MVAYNQDILICDIFRFFPVASKDLINLYTDESHYNMVNTLRPKQNGGNFENNITIVEGNVLNLDSDFNETSFPGCPILIRSAFFRQWLGIKQAPDHYQHQWWPDLLMLICVT